MLHAVPWSTRSALQWLLPALALLACCGAPPATAPPAAVDGNPPTERSWLIEAELGIDFVHESGGTGELHFPEIMGAGAALLDADGDGDLDAYLINGAFDLGAAPAADGPVNRLFLQQPDGRFADATAGSGLGDPGYGMGVAAGDVDNDGRVDLYVTNYGRDRLFRNLGGGRFADVTAAAGIAVDGWSTSATFCDYDRDGWLDLYVARYVDYDPAIRCYDLAGRPDYCDPTSFPGLTDLLLRNRGDGTFEDRSAAAGLAATGRAGLGVVSADLDGDRLADFYVANDRQPNQLWINLGDGRFRDDALVLGASVNEAGEPEAGMGVVAADLDGDAGLDLFVTHMAGESNTLYRRLPGAGFDDRTLASGLGVPSLPRTGFGVVAADLEHDGDLDLLVANGRVIRGAASEEAGGGPWARYSEPNQLFLNDGSGRFAGADSRAGAFAPRHEISRGLAAGDVDGDGDLDLLLSNAQGPARLYLNQAPGGGHWLGVDAFDLRLGRRALGAEITVTAGERRWLRLLSGSSSYLSSSDPRAHFGLGEAARVDRLTVRWPDGAVEEFPGGAVDRQLVLVRGEGSPLAEAPR